MFRGYRAPHGGEVDLVCRDGRTLCFVEVKTRRSLDYGRPVEAVTAAKQALVIRGAMEWLRRLGEKNEGICYRFDVVEVLLIANKSPEVTWLKSAFNG